MTAPSLSASAPLTPEIAAAFGAEITNFLADRDPLLAAIAHWTPSGSGLSEAPVGAGHSPVVEWVRRLAAEFTAGGKRLRPAFAVWGYASVAGTDSVPAPVWTAAAALDLLHVSALVHDDVMDNSDLRRGRPAAHRQAEAWHRELGWSGDPQVFGRAMAILLGDLLVLWSAEMVDSAGLSATQLRSGLPILHLMRSEVTLGQMLDVVDQSHPLSEPDLALSLQRAAQVVEHKSARYTVQRPLQFGASLAGADAALLQDLAGYGSAVGRAFQYRDDLLGVFGDAQLTGKPSGDDLREGKRTVLVAHARAGLSAAGREEFDQHFANPNLTDEGVARLRQLIIDSGAHDEVEAMITHLHATALAALDQCGLPSSGKDALRGLAAASLQRRS